MVSIQNRFKHRHGEAGIHVEQLVDLCEVECELLCVAGGSVDLPCTTPIRLPCKSTIWDIEVVLGVLGP